MKNDGKTKTDGMSMGGSMHKGLKSADRVPMGVELPSKGMHFMREGGPPDQPTLGPRTA